MAVVTFSASINLRAVLILCLDRDYVTSLEFIWLKICFYIANCLQMLKHVTIFECIAKNEFNRNTKIQVLRAII